MATIEHRQHRFALAVALRRQGHALAQTQIGATWRACRLLALGGVAEGLGARDARQVRDEMAAAVEYRRYEQRERASRRCLLSARGEVPAVVRA